MPLSVRCSLRQILCFFVCFVVFCSFIFFLRKLPCALWEFYKKVYMSYGITWYPPKCDQNWKDENIKKNRSYYHLCLFTKTEMSSNFSKMTTFPFQYGMRSANAYHTETETSSGVHKGAPFHAIYAPCVIPVLCSRSRLYCIASPPHRVVSAGPTDETQLAIPRAPVTVY